MNALYVDACMTLAKTMSRVPDTNVLFTESNKSSMKQMKKKMLINISRIEDVCIVQTMLFFDNIVKKFWQILSKCNQFVTISHHYTLYNKK